MALHTKSSQEQFGADNSKLLKEYECGHVRGLGLLWYDEYFKMLMVTKIIVVIYWVISKCQRKFYLSSY